MKSPCNRFISTVAVLFVAALAAADQLADFKKWYTTSMPGMVKAMESKNIGFFHKASTKDFTYTEMSGKSSDKKTALAGLKQMMDTSEKIKLKAQVGAFKAAKGGIAVDVTNYFNITTKPGPDKKTHKMTMELKTRETWVKSGGQWLLKNITDVATSKMTMDGKPMPTGPGS